MRGNFSNERRSAVLGENRPLAWWRQERGIRRRWIRPAGNAFKVRRTRLMPKEVREISRWWPVLRAGIVAVSIVMPILTLKYGDGWKLHYESWRSERSARRLVVEAEAGKPEEMVGKLMPALEEHPKQPEVIRKLAWATVGTYPKQAETLFRRLQDLGEASLEDQIELSRLQVASGAMDQAESLLAGLMRVHAGSPLPWIEYARVAMLAADSIKAQSALREALRLDPENVVAQVELTTLLVESTEAAVREEAMNGLLALCEQRTRAGAMDEAFKLAERFLKLDVATLDQKGRFV